MRHLWILVHLTLAVAALVFSGAGARSREVPVFCDPPTITTVGRGQTFNGKLCLGYWGCVCAVRFCSQCSTLPSPPLSCSLATCRPLPPPMRQR
jgi:hypothetical protein